MPSLPGYAGTIYVQKGHEGEVSAVCDRCDMMTLVQGTTVMSGCPHVEVTVLDDVSIFGVIQHRRQKLAAASLGAPDPR